MPTLSLPQESACLSYYSEGGVEELSSVSAPMLDTAPVMSCTSFGCTGS